MNFTEFEAEIMEKARLDLMRKMELSLFFTAEQRAALGYPDPPPAPEERCEHCGQVIRDEEDE